MGDARRYRDDGRLDIHPAESHCDGCPGGWYRSAFVDSVTTYERHLFDGGFSANVALDRTTDPLVIESTQYLESQRLRHRNYWNGKTSGA